MTLRSAALLLLTPLFLPSCSGYHAGRTYRVEYERVIAKPFDSVWANVGDFCRINSFTVIESDSTTGFLSFYGSADGRQLDSAFDCGHLSTLDGEMTSRNFKCNVTLERASWDSTLVEIKPIETASIHYAEKDKWATAECNSTGKFEHQLFDVLSGAPTHFSIARLDSAEPPSIDTEYSGERVWLGAAMMPYTIRNVRNVHISDWQMHGSGSDEGRLVLPLNDLKTSGNHGGILAAISADAGNWTPFGELQFELGSTIALQLAVGTLYDFGRSGNMTFNLVPQIGWLHLYNNILLSDIAGKYTSSEFPEYTLYSGDTVDMYADGFLTQLGLDVDYALGPRTSLYLSGSYSKTYFGHLSFKVGDNHLDMNSAAIVEPTVDSKGNGSTLHASVSPQVLSSGLAVQVGVRIRLR